MDFEAIRVDAYPIDSDLVDAGNVGPDLSAAAQAYLATPRALVWRNPSSDWRLFVLLLPLASRLSLMTNPIFAQLTRDWGHNVRFVGVDRHQCVHDFRSLLTDTTLKKLVGALAHWLHDGRRNDAATLDVLFAALASSMLTILEDRGDDWGRHLAREHRLDVGERDSLFDRASRYPDFLAQLRQALRDEMIDVQFYGKVLRSMDLREAAAETRVAGLIEATLEPVTLVKLGRSRAGRHLGCYNWLLLGPRHAAQRANVLSKLPLFAQFFAAALIDAQPCRRSGLVAAAEHESLRSSAHARRGLAADPDTLRQAVDSGQDRWVVEALAGHFGVQPNVIRALWRGCPVALGTPPAWHLKQILLRLNELPERNWPRTDPEWVELAARAVPAIAG
jgi:hypothetical protein